MSFFTLDGGNSFLAVWRIIVGLSLIPAFGTLYQRLTLPEAPRYIESKKIHSEEDNIDEVKKGETDADKRESDVDTDTVPVGEKKAHFAGRYPTFII
jgi:PHS family inorganic phosphate transporter-like MFS transporter